jgi:UDP-N-acetylmuramoyl-tripeptide--D-alanyl-D-alanine ligase
VKTWSGQQVAAAIQGELVRDAPSGPRRAVIDSRAVEPGDLFVGIPGENHDGGAFARPALEAGAWGVIVAPPHAGDAAAAPSGAVIAVGDPVRALGALAREWRRALGCAVFGVTGSTGKTSTKDLLAAMLTSHRQTVFSHANLNTEIGLPLAVLEAPEGTEALVLEMAMRGAGQIAELAEIAEPDVGVIVNVGPVHLELLGSLEAVAAAKAELIGGIRPGGTAIVPAGEPLLDPHVAREDIRFVTFGEGGDVTLGAQDGDRVEIVADGESHWLELPLTQAHHRVNALAAFAAARAIGVRPEGRVEVVLSALRGERVRLPNGVVVINDCYNANPMSMRAALDDLSATAEGRRVAVLGDMLELGAQELEYHAEVGRQANERGVDVLVTVGRLAMAMADTYDGGAVYPVANADEAAALLPDLLEPGDTVLVKASRGVGLEVVAEALAE